jgi:hypothetical protein
MRLPVDVAWSGHTVGSGLNGMIHVCGSSNTVHQEDPNKECAPTTAEFKNNLEYNHYYFKKHKITFISK